MTKLSPIFFLLAFLSACATSNGNSHTDPALNGEWVVRKAELAGKDFPVPASFTFTVTGNDYRAGTPFNNDRGTLVLFGDAPGAAGARLDMIGDVFGNPVPIKGRRIQAIYRFTNSERREVEICYDLTELARPATFATRAGTELLCMVYGRK